MSRLRNLRVIQVEFLILKSTVFQKFIFLVVSSSSQYKASLVTSSVMMAHQSVIILKYEKYNGGLKIYKSEQL